MKSKNTKIDFDLFANGEENRPRLLADIGGTHARFAFEIAPRQFDAIEVFPCQQFSTLSLAIECYLAHHPELASQVQHAAIAIANPIAGDEVVMTNHHWRFSIETMRHAFGWRTLLVTNDFTALALSIPHLKPHEVEAIGGGEGLAHEVIGLLGSGTGLGVSGLIRVKERWVALGSEGGHVSFAPGNALEAAILNFAWHRYQHVSFERLLSGPGIELLFQALCAIHQAPPQNLTTPEIVERSQQQTCELCVETTNVFSALLGAFAGNLAVTLGCRGGLYIGGGVVGKMGRAFNRPLFRSRFEAKGRFEAYVCRIPTLLIRAQHPAFLGVSSILSDHLAQGNRHNSLVAHINLAYPTLSAAERRVADLVLGDPHFVMNQSISEIAQRAKVSQPTVIRFCRSAGVDGLSQFKLKLAAMDHAVPLIHSQVQSNDAVENVSHKVLDNTLAALVNMRKTINGEVFESAINDLRHATRIEIFAVGQSVSVAIDAENKLVRFGIPTTVRQDTTMQKNVAETLISGNVVLVFSRTGEMMALNQAVAVAADNGASVIAIAPANSSLAQRAKVTIASDLGLESDMAMMPMLSRLQQLVLLDMLVIGLSLHKPHRQKKLSIHQFPFQHSNHALPLTFGDDE
jgi:glucokinase